MALERQPTVPYRRTGAYGMRWKRGAKLNAVGDLTPKPAISVADGQQPEGINMVRVLDPLLKQCLLLLPFACPFALRTELLPICNTSHQLSVVGTVFLAAILVAAVNGSSIFMNLCKAFSALAVLSSIGWLYGLSVINLISSFAIDWFYFLFSSGLGGIAIGIGSSYVSGSYNPDFRRPIRDRRQALEDRALGLGYIVVGVSAVLVLWTGGLYYFFLATPCELGEWSRWSPCGPNEVMRRWRWVKRPPGLLAEPCGPITETGSCSSADQFDV